MRLQRVAGWLVAVVVVTGAVLALRGGGGGPTDQRSPARSAAVRGERVIEAVPDGPPALLYMKKDALHKVVLESGRDARLGTLAADAAVGSPGGDWVAEVVPLEIPTAGGRDFVLEPELRLLEMGSGRETTLGPGFAPLWGPDGKSLVWLRPLSPRLCSGEVCRGAVEVVAFDLETGRERVLLESGRWGLLSWLGERVLVSDARNLGRALSVSLEGVVERMQLAPSEVWAGSPDGEWLIAVRAGRPEVLDVEGGVERGEAASVPTGGGLLAEGAWAPDSSLVASVLLGGAYPGARLVVFAPQDPELRQLGRSRGASGPVLWARDASVFVALRDAGFEREVAACWIEQRACRPLLRYGRDVALVGLTGG